MLKCPRGLTVTATARWVARRVVGGRKRRKAGAYEYRTTFSRKPLSARKVEEISQTLLLELIKQRAIRRSARVLKTARSTQDHVNKIGMPKPSWCLKYHNDDDLPLT